MEFNILYCGPCGYHGRAEELAAELRRRLGALVIVEEGKFGQFDVLLDGELVASKGGFWKRMLKHGAPPQAEILKAIECALADREGDACEIPKRAWGLAGGAEPVRPGTEYPAGPTPYDHRRHRSHANSVRKRPAVV